MKSVAILGNRCTRRVRGVLLGVAMMMGFQGPFRGEDEWIFPMCNLGVGADLMRGLVETPHQPANVEVVGRICWERISRQVTGPGGHFGSVPADYDAMMVFTSEVEGRGCPYTPAGNGLADLFMDQFNDRFLPKSLHPVGGHLVLIVVFPPRLSAVVMISASPIR